MHMGNNAPEVIKMRIIRIFSLLAAECAEITCMNYFVSESLLSRRNIESVFVLCIFFFISMHKRNVADIMQRKMGAL
jgi:hypothetical protein